MMKLTKEIFKELEAEKKKADAHAFNVDVAIQSLQNICEHEYESDSLAGQYEQPSCKICGKEFNPVRLDNYNTEPVVMTKEIQNFIKNIKSINDWRNGGKK